MQFDTLAGFSAVIDRLGEFQEVVDVKLRHTHPRVKRQRAAAASLAAAVALATSTSSDDGAEPLEASAHQQSAATAAATLEQQQVNETQQDSSSTTSATSATSDSDIAAPGIQVVHVLPDQSGSSSSSRRGVSGDVLLELDHVSINTPDGSLALVQDLSIKVQQGES